MERPSPNRNSLCEGAVVSLEAPNACWTSLRCKRILLMQQGRENTVRRHDWCLVDDEILNFVLGDLPRRCIQGVYGNPINIKRFSKRTLGKQHNIPRYANGRTAKIVHHSNLNTRFRSRVQEANHGLKNREGSFVVLQASQLCS